MRRAGSTPDTAIRGGKMEQIHPGTVIFMKIELIAYDWSTALRA
jgi:hypothetical protein